MEPTGGDEATLAPVTAPSPSEVESLRLEVASLRAERASLQAQLAAKPDKAGANDCAVLSPPFWPGSAVP